MDALAHTNIGPRALMIGQLSSYVLFFRRLVVWIPRVSFQRGAVGICIVKDYIVKNLAH